MLMSFDVDQNIGSHFIDCNLIIRKYFVISVLYIKINTHLRYIHNMYHIFVAL